MTEPPTIDPLHDVSFARKSSRSGVLGDEERFARLAILAGTAIFVLGSLWLVAGAAIALLGPAALQVGAIAALVALVVVPVVAVTAAGYNTPQDWRKIPNMADDARRIHVLCPPRHMERHGAIDDADFEPEYFRVFMVAPRTWLECFVFAIALLAAVPTGFILRHFGLQGRTPFGLWAWIGVAMVAVACISQTYIRIAPGRVDLLTFALWRSKASRFRSLDLRSNCVVIDPRRRRLVVEDPPDRHRPERRSPSEALSFVGSIAPGRLSQTLLRAAVSTAPIPDLPRDRLHD